MGDSFTVLGGGIVGLCVARRLAQRGCDVVLVERGRVGEGASGASAGILSSPSGTRSPFHRAMAASLEGYPRFVEELAGETGIDPEFLRPGILHVARDVEEEEEFRKRFHRFREAGLAAAWWDAGEVRRRLPSLSRKLGAGLLLPETARVHPPALLEALRRSLEAQGGSVREGFREVRLTRQEGDPEVELVSHGGERERLAGRRIVVCAGAWTGGALREIGVELEAEVIPIRGQMVELELGESLPVLLHVGDVYLISRTGGRLWVGATVEEVGFDDGVTGEGVDFLLESSRAAFPSLERAAPVRAWAGLRPKILRRGGALLDTDLDGGRIAVAAGHYRNGILLGPRDADLLAGRLLGVDPGRLSPFR